MPSTSDELRALRQQLEDVVHEIRTIPGLGSFLSEPSVEDLLGADPQSALVYLGASRFGSIALSVKDGEVRQVPLPGLELNQLEERARAHQEAYERYLTRTDASDRSGWDRALEDVTGWLYDNVMGPVLETVDVTGGLVLVPGGLLGALPLHAAWTEDLTRPTGRRFALDDATISYVPNAQALSAARRLAARAGTGRLLALAEPAPVPGSRLPLARAEVAVVAEHFAESDLLVGPEATWLSFEWKAPVADVLHLACHGMVDLVHPLESRLILAGGVITLRRLLELKIAPRLAVLSACETSTPGRELPDEVVSLATGLLQAGAAGVVASQWAVPDHPTAMLMVRFYRGWKVEELPPAAALCAAQQWVRDSTDEEKRAWLSSLLADREAEPGQQVLEQFLRPLTAAGHRSQAALHNWAAFTFVGA